MWNFIQGLFDNLLGSLFDRINQFLIDTLKIDETLLGLYDQFVAPLPEWIKILGIIFVGIILVLGTLSFVKKMLKLFIVIAVILAIVVLATQLNG
jgi:type IV secretory pathway VirB2 component (pilin)